MKEKIKRDRSIQVRLSEEEYEAVERKFRNSGMKSRSAFFRAMIFEGYIVNFDESELKQLNSLASNIASNINQIAVRANSGGGIFADDISEIKESVNKLWQPLNYFQSLLLQLKH